MKDSSNAASSEEVQKESTKAKVKDQPSPGRDGEAEGRVGPESATDDAAAAPSDAPPKETKKDQDKESLELAKASPSSPAPREKLQMKEEKKKPVSVEDSDSERELVIDLGEEQGGRDKKRSRRDHTTIKESSAGKSESEICSFFKLLVFVATFFLFTTFSIYFTYFSLLHKYISRSKCLSLCCLFAV